MTQGNVYQVCKSDFKFIYKNNCTIRQKRYKVNIHLLLIQHIKCNTACIVLGSIYFPGKLYNNLYSNTQRHLKAAQAFPHLWS